MKDTYTCRCGQQIPFSRHILLHPEAKIWTYCPFCMWKALIFAYRVIRWEKPKETMR